MRFLLFLVFFPLTIFSQETFSYKSNKQQFFNLRPGTDKTFHYIQMDKADITLNTLFLIDANTEKLIIPEDGYYELSASFYFNPSTSVIKFNRAGVNFGIVQIFDGVEEYVAATRKSFDQDNQDEFSRIEVHPTIVYLSKDAVVAGAISAGLLGNPLLSCELGCNRKNKNCTSFAMTIKLISDQDGFQRYY
ncbi:hypothetical protein MG290_08170 [Flavobacterium sp. CBA20B-1]|uniref:hypothetical protein n=1 Tax=unclassified Flavobacterium TaxID=196869 RepID=UPI002223FD59|nr:MULTISPECIES: hypothetical protein [unclassified Flavobacterium]WCM40940.1 hypothetical protein MG290_08170 [Flavobacterium sp. CBA20B-1]